MYDEYKLQFRAGIQLVLAPRTRVPVWLSVSTKWVKRERRIISNKVFNVLLIKPGHARFVTDGMVAVIINGWEEEGCAFGPTAVLQIRSFDGKRVIAQNYRFCEACFTNTGVCGKSHHIGESSRVEAEYVCTCGNTWTREF